MKKKLEGQQKQKEFENMQNNLQLKANLENLEKAQLG